MSKSIDELVSEVLSLPPRARAFVAEKLIESLDAIAGDGLSPAWREEVRRRCREIDEESVTLRDAEETFSRAYSALE